MCSVKWSVQIEKIIFLKHFCMIINFAPAEHGIREKLFWDSVGVSIKNEENTKKLYISV